MLGFIKQLRGSIVRMLCSHEPAFIRNIHGDEINALGLMRSAWRCGKCKAVIYKPELHKPTGQLKVWFGGMPESNGKSNWTAILYRDNNGSLLDMADGVTIDRSEYSDRVRYSADRVRYLLGHLPNKPDIRHYDADLKAVAPPFTFKTKGDNRMRPEHRNA